MGRSASLDEVEKRKVLTLPGFELLTLCRLACRQPLYQLHYTVSRHFGKVQLFLVSVDPIQT
jgi:hypothetical protein